MMSGYTTGASTKRPLGTRYRVVPDPKGWRVARGACTTSPFARLADAMRLAHRLQREADGLRGMKV